LVQKTLELTFRPIYFQAVASENKRSEWRLYRFWFALNTLAGIFLLIVFVGGSGLIVEYLLGDQYKGSVVLIPYLATGHLLLITAYNLNSYLYAHQHTKKIFFFSLVTAIASVIIVVLFANLWGLIGAAAACIAYFAIQASLLLRFIWLRERR
jgi:O-antigen/teichoic acid export membrane protein